MSTQQQKKTKLEVVEQDAEPAAVEQPAEDPPGDQPQPIVLVDIVFRGTTFKIPRDMDEWDTEACLSLSQSDYVLAAKQLLGTGQWALLQSLGSKRKDIREFLTAFADVIDKDCVG